MMIPRLSILVASALAAAAGGAVASGAASQALAGVSGGQWELVGVPGQKSALRQCVADPLQLALVEHKNAKCTTTVLGDTGSSVKLSFQCAGGGFGQATIKTITPRSLRIETQGIADGAPYSDVFQAHRVGECPAKAERGR